MKVTILNEAGYLEALYGLGKSYGLTTGFSYVEFLANKELQERLHKVAEKLAPKDSGHNKFMEHIDIWLCINAPRYWWQQFDTYRVDVTRQSSSTMHTIMKAELTQDDFEKHIPGEFLHYINMSIADKKFDEVKNILPEGFLQERTVKMSYKSVRKIILQRKNHRLAEWQLFCRAVLQSITSPELLGLDLEALHKEGLY